MMAYVDESVTDKDYVVAAALVNELDADTVRLTMEILLTRRQRKVHWHEESALRKRYLAHALTRMKWWEHLILVRVAGGGERLERQRRLCLERLWYELLARGVDDVVLECRSKAQDKADLQHLAAMRSRRQHLRQLRIRHVPGTEDPRLACADIVAGAYRAAQGGDADYLDGLGKKVKVIEVELNWGR